MTATVFTGTPTITQHLVPTASLNTLEKIGLWFLLLFHRLNKSKDLFLIDDGQVKQSSYQRFEGKDGTLYLGFTTFMPVPADYEVLPNKPWTYAIELNNAVASDNYNS
jgi:hypothetical protein